MKIVPIIILMMVFTTIQSQAQVTKEVDEFTGDVTYKTERFPISIEKGEVIQSVGVFTRYEENSYFFTHAVISSEWQHLSDNILYFIIDGNRYQYSVAYSDSDMNTSGANVNLTEASIVLMNKDDLRRIAESVSARFKFGSNVYEISQSGKQYAERLLSEVK